MVALRGFVFDQYVTILPYYAVLVFSLKRKKNLVISSATAGMIASPSTTLHSRAVRKCVLKMGCRKGRAQTSNNNAMDKPTAYCIHLFENMPILNIETRSDRTV